MAIEAVGTPATFELAVKLVRPGGRVANIGVHGKPAMLHLEDQWARDITITTGLVDASSTPTLMRLVATGQLDASRFVTHRFSMDDFEQAYDVFGDAAANGALKVVLTRQDEEEEEDRMSTFVKDVMTAKVIWVERDTPFAAIAAALREYRVSAFPVLDEAGQVIGVVSESDLLAKLALGGGEDGTPGMIAGILHQHEMEKARAVTAGDLMTSPAATVSPDDTLEHAARLMYVRRVKRLQS